MARQITHITNLIHGISYQLPRKSLKLQKIKFVPIKFKKSGTMGEQN